MSSRALRRLRVEQEASLAEEHDDDESSSDEEQNDGGGGGFMAMLEEESSSEEESSESDDEEEDQEDQPAVAASSNKSKKGQATAKKDQAPVEEEEDLDAILSDMKIQNEITGDEAENNDPSASTKEGGPQPVRENVTHVTSEILSADNSYVGLVHLCYVTRN